MDDTKNETAGEANPNFFKRNFILGVATGALINVGMAFIDPFTVLPVFIAKLGGSATLIGLVSALHGAGWFLPQIFASRLAETRDRLMNMYRLGAAVRSLLLLGAALSIFFIDSTGGGVFLAVFVVVLWLSHLIGGLNAIPFLEITSKTIPVTSRGRFFGTRRLIGGLVGIVAGMVVGLVIDEGGERFFMRGPMFEALERVIDKIGLLGHTFPLDFGILFICAWGFITLGVIVFSFAGEPPAARVERSARFIDTVRSGFSLIRHDASYRHFYFVRICWQFTAMGFPFYTSYAYTELHYSASLVGLFLSIWVGSGVFSNYIWGRLLDRDGNKIVLLITAALSALPPLVVLVLNRATHQGATSAAGWVLLMVCSTFAINGFIRSGRVISNITYLLEFAPEGKRPLYVGFMNSFTFPFMLSPIVGGIILQFFGYSTLFSICLFFALANFLLSFGLREPRQRAL